MKVMSLADAVTCFTWPGDHLHFASTPSRSNAAVREVARRYVGTRPDFVISCTGFHSTAHLLALLRLGRRYISCFFGDNYPQPRPNTLYTTLLREGYALEHWSLSGYVAALRAGATGLPYALTRPADATSLTAELAAAGRFHAIADPGDPHRRLGLLAALCPDVTFVHAPLGDPTGRVACFAPYGEGHWGAAAATRGVVATVERVVTPDEFDSLPNPLVLPPHRVLAVCAEPYGAHPQPLHAPAGLPRVSYRDDFDHYQKWREVAESPDRMKGFRDRVLAADGSPAYQRFVGADRLAALHPGGPPTLSVPRRPPGGTEPASTAELMIVRAARIIADLVEHHQYQVVLAGIGHSYTAARLAHALLGKRGIEVPVLVETGLYGIDCGPRGGAFPLGLDTIAGAHRLTGIEDVLTTLTCGANNRCVGVIGAAQVDPTGAVNSTRTALGRQLVGSGGAHDIGNAADEVIVLARCTPERLVPRVDYVTTPGHHVRHVVTDVATFRRATPHDAWTVLDLDAGDRRAYRRCGWDPLPHDSGSAPMPPPEAHELTALRALPDGGVATQAPAHHDPTGRTTP
ncbi:CoA-transferase [Streptomyces lavendulae]|uniref:CoA-transferase n=1 Tax=Streptomyces lavendulae TaxID=1914 RepID=UPI00255274EC|nr:CoA-transferase [Streptomyces lavendulae]